MIKKFLISIFTLCFLAGCGPTEGESSINEQEQTNPEDEVICELVDEFEFFSTESEFLDSPACQRLKETGADIYLLEYDTERYSLSQINVNVCFYTYCLYDNINNTGVSVEILYDPTISDVGTLQSVLGNEKSVIVTAEKDGSEYDVYLSAGLYVDYEDYSLSYIPFENHRVSIYSSAHTSKEDILEYFDDFEFIKVDEQ